MFIHDIHCDSIITQSSGSMGKNALYTSDRRSKSNYLSSNSCPILDLCWVWSAKNALLN